MSEVDPNPDADPQAKPELGGREMPDAGDPTDGGRHGEIGEAPSIAADEPDPAGNGYAVGGGSAREEQDAPPVADPGA